MAYSLKKRWHLLRQAVWDRLLPRWLTIIIGLVSAWDLLVGQFLPPKIAETMPRVFDFVSITSELLPWWGWLLILMATITISTVEYLYRHIKKVDVEPDANSIDIELTPSSGPSPDIRLSIKNLGVAAEFSATCRTIAARNDVNKLRTGVFNLRWKSTEEKWIEISKNEGQELFIARWQMWEDHGLCQIDVLEWSETEPREFTGTRWNLGNEEEPLPEFDLEISIFQKGASEPKVVEYILRPATQFGPLEMVPLSLAPKVVADPSADKFPKANLDEWRSVDPLYIWQAGCLWKGVKPKIPVTFENPAYSRFTMLLRAVEHGELEHKESDLGLAYAQVTRKDLTKYAVRKDGIPEFLSDIVLDETDDVDREYISLNEATTRAYEETEGTLIAGIAEDPLPSGNMAILTWFACAIVGSDWKTPIYGKKLPSRIRRRIPADEIKNCDFSDDARTLSQGSQKIIRYVDLEIKEDDFRKRLSEIKTWNGN